MSFISRFIGCFTLFLLGFAPVFAASITLINVEQVDGQTRVSISYDAPVAAPKVFSLGEGKPRIVIDVKDAKAAFPTILENAVDIAAIRHAKRDKGTRLVIDLAAKGRLASHNHTARQTIILLKPNQSVAPVAVTSSPAIAPKVAPIITAARARAKSPAGIAIPRIKPAVENAIPYHAARKPLIVIDPGHGGYDPGAIGNTGTKEKTVTLKAAQELQKQLLASGRYQVLLTRTKDVYVGLDERVRRTRVRDADLFISLHADSLESSSTRGASVYTLANYARGRGAKVVDTQNWIMDVDLSETSDTVDSILVSLAQNKTFSNSHRFAQMLIPEIEKVAPILRNTHRRKGLAVLLAPDVPAVLLEMGYISNAIDERALNSPYERTRKMRAVRVTIDSYFASQNF